MSNYRDVRIANIFFCERLKITTPYTTCIKRHQRRKGSIGEPPVYPFCFNCEKGEENFQNRRSLGLVECSCCGRPKRIKHYFNHLPVCSTCYLYCKEAKSKNYSFKDVSDFMKNLVKEYGDSLSVRLQKRQIALPWKTQQKIQKSKSETENDLSKDVKFEDLFDEIVIINGPLLKWLSEEMKATNYNSIEEFTIEILNKIKESNSISNIL